MKMRYLRMLLGLAILYGAAGWLAAQPTSTPGIRVDLIKYADLGKLIAAHKGKVVVVDFWADFCVPCKREFPRLVELHARYKNAGLVGVSVALDNPADANKRVAIQEFLTKQKADGLTNVHLNETPEVWQKKLGVDGPPCVYIFNRDGRIAAKWNDKVDYSEIERAVAELMKQ